MADNKENYYYDNYNTVKSRVDELRLKYGFDLRIETEIIKYDYELDIANKKVPFCIIKATIKDKDGVILSTGQAREVEAQGGVNYIHFLENCETSAIGRALAFAGFSEMKNTTIASPEDIERAKDQKKDLEVEKQKQKAKELAEQTVDALKGSTAKIEKKIEELEKVEPKKEVKKEYTEKDIKPFDNPKKGKRLKPEWQPIHEFLVKEDILEKIPDALVRADIGYRTTQDFILKCTYDEFLTVINKVK